MNFNKDYVSAKILQQKMEDHSRASIFNNIQQDAGKGKNILLEAQKRIHDNVSNNIYHVEENGNTTSIAEAREKEKVRRYNHAKIWLIPIVGWIFFGIDMHRVRRFKAIKRKERKQLTEELINALETNPAFLAAARKYVNELPKASRQLYQKCLKVVTQHMNNGEDAYDKTVEDILDIVSNSRDVQIDEQALEQLFQKYAPEKVKTLLNDALSKNNMQISIESNDNPRKWRSSNSLIKKITKTTTPVVNH